MNNPIPQQEDLIEIGTIVSPQGNKGEVRVYPVSDFPERFKEPGLRWLQYPKQMTSQPISLLKGRQASGKNLYMLQFEGIDDRDKAETLRDCKLFVKKSDRPQLEDDEYHVDDLIDLEVFDHRSKELIGIVSDIFWAGNDLLEVTLTQPISSPDTAKKKKLVEKVMIPFVKEIVPVVDLKAKRLEIMPPPGLLEVNLV